MESQNNPSETFNERQSGMQTLSLPADSETVSTLPPPARRQDAALAVGSGAAYLALFFITLRLPFGQNTVVVATLLSLLLVLLFTVTAARALRSRRALALASLISGAISMPYVAIPILFARFPTWGGWPAIGAGFMRY